MNQDLSSNKMFPNRYCVCVCVCVSATTFYVYSLIARFFCVFFQMAQNSRKWNIEENGSGEWKRRVQRRRKNWQQNQMKKKNMILLHVHFESIFILIQRNGQIKKYKIWKKWRIQTHYQIDFLVMFHVHVILNVLCIYISYFVCVCIPSKK